MVLVGTILQQDGSGKFAKFLVGETLQWEGVLVELDDVTSYYMCNNT
jgi:hypothetical protein